MRHHVRLLGSLSVCILWMLLFGTATAKVEVKPKKDDMNLYMYLSVAKQEDVFPIRETLASLGPPDFLTDPDYPKARVVEFYAHWCPHCKHFKPKYIKFARGLQKVIQDLNLDVEVETLAVSCVPHRKSCTANKILGYPQVKLFPAHSVNSTFIRIGDLHPKTVLEKLGITTGEHYSDEKAVGHHDQKGQKTSKKVRGAAAAANNDHQTQPVHFGDRSKKETFLDAHLSLRFLLENGVYTSPGPLEAGTRKEALRNFLKVLQDTLPSSCSMQPLIQDLLVNFKETVCSGEEGLQSILKKHPLPDGDTQWSPACLQHGTGYTCGLWTLFHISSVGLVEWNQLAAGNTNLRLPPGQVADCLRQVIEFFFQCEACRVNFLQDYDACGHDRCNRLTNEKGTKAQEWMEYPLWLFETHNGVNARLRKERLAAGEQEDTTTEAQVLWPPVERCPSCWLSEGRWDEEKVYRWLRLQYWPEDYLSETIRKEMKLQDGSLPIPVANNVAEPKTAAKVSVHDEDGLLSSMPDHPLVFVLLALFGLGGMVLFRRKQQFNRKGYHKKRESFSYA